MSVRVYVPFNVEPETPVEQVAEAAELRERFQGPFVRAGAVKVFLDGVLESRTALLVEPYAGEAELCGEALHGAERFQAIAVAADRLALQIAVHACGDGAVRRALDGFVHSRRVNGARDSRHRIEHIELVHPADLHRFAELGVVASMQLAHSPTTAHGHDVWQHRAGPARWRYSFAWQSLRDAGARQAYGSDWPVAPLDPLLGIWNGLARQPWQPGDPVQRQSLAQLLDGYTRDAAYTEFQEQAKGRLRAGLLADLVLLDHNLFQTPLDALRQVRPVLTMVDGRIVWRTY